MMEIVPALTKAPYQSVIQLTVPASSLRMTQDLIYLDDTISQKIDSLKDL